MSEKIKKIIFKSYRQWLNVDSFSVPKPSQEVVPLWYKEADRFAKDPNTGEYYKAPQNICPYPKEGTKDDYGFIPTWKACPAIMDSFITGYVLKTPCDIKFFKDSNQKIDVEILDKRHSDFVSKRGRMAQFYHPEGYYEEHFAWYPDWGLELPDGYSALYMTPMNRFDLPFLNTTGIVDNDKVFISGTFPFFIIKDWEGTIPAGTPYMQILPFKRENWESEVEIQTQSTIYDKLLANMKFYRKPDGGVYKNKIWSKRDYR